MKLAFFGKYERKLMPSYKDGISSV